MTVFLRTERLVLRRFTDADVDNLVELDSDPEVMRYLTGEPTPRDYVVDHILPHYEHYYRTFDGLGYWAIEEAATGDFLGWFELAPPKDGPHDDAELGYRLHRRAWGKGYAAEGAIAFVDKGFAELGLNRVHAHTMAVNMKSRRVMEKVGLRYVRTFHEHFDDPLPGTEHGEVEYAVTKDEWTARN